MNLPDKSQIAYEPSAWEQLKQDCSIEEDQARKDLHEILVLIEQSQLETSKLQQKNASITAQLQQIQSQIDMFSKNDIRTVYDSALDAQQRLFVMRGQIDKLQSDQTRIEHYLAVLERVNQAFESKPSDAEIASKEQNKAGKAIEMIIQAQEAERRRLARQMHDGPAQALSNFILQAEIAMRLFDIDQAKAKDELSEVKTTASSTFQKVRDFIFDLRPMMLDDLGLAPTITRYVETFKNQTGIEVRLISTGAEQRFEPYLELMVFRAIQELLTNISQHSQATQVILQMDSSANELRVSIEDNGLGFDVDKVRDKAGTGLKVINDRVQMLGGTMEINSTSGHGSHILFQIPTSGASAFA
jgi:two-component system sensor histidine kinase DegS